MFYFRIKECYSILCIFGKTWLYIALHDFNLTYYSSIILGSFSILLFPKLCWHIGLTPTRSHLSITQARSFFECLDMRTFTYTTPTFIAKPFRPVAQVQLLLSTFTVN